MRRYLDTSACDFPWDAFRHLNPDVPAYSWWSNRGNARANDVGWRIDYVLATPNVPLARAWIDKDASLSDHAPVTVELATAPPGPEPAGA